MRLYSTALAKFAFDQVLIDIPSKEANGRVYLTWQPVKATISLKASPGQTRGITLRNAGKTGGGQVLFGDARFATTKSELTLDVQGDAPGVEFWIAGGTASSEDGDAAIEAVAGGGAILAVVPMMVRIRKNAETLTAAERMRFLRALGRLNAAGGGGFATFRAMHEAGMEDEAHLNPAFLAWHRAYILELERELQALDPSVTLPYWRFDQAAPKLFSTAFLGQSPSLGKRVRFVAGHPLRLWRTDHRAGIKRRPLKWNDKLDAPPQKLEGKDFVIDEAATLALGVVFHTFRRMESRPHGAAHTCWDGFLPDTSEAPRDPLFFLLHSNIDRLWAKWQNLNSFKRTNALDLEAFLALRTDRDVNPLRTGHFLNDTMWPWNGITGDGSEGERPAFTIGGDFTGSTIANGPPPEPRIYDMIDYQGVTTEIHLGYDYDELPFEQPTSTPQFDNGLPPVPDDVNWAFIDLANPSLSSDERFAAFQALTTEAFGTAAFSQHRADFLQLLRTLVTDADPLLRELALSTLARHEDALAESLLLQGLQDPTSSLVPPLIALQLLGDDDHAAVVPVARDLLANSTDPALRAEAAHLLSSDPTAISLLAGLVADKTEHGWVREASALSLSILDPPAFELLAQNIAADPSDFPEIRALTRTALALLDNGGGGSPTV